MKHNKQGDKIIYRDKQEYLDHQGKRSLRFRELSDRRIKHHLPYLKFISKEITKKDKILDAGCRNGLVLQWLLSKGFRSLHGIDIVARNVEECKKGNLPVIKGDCRDLFMFKKETFDLVYCTHVLEHIPEPDKAVGEFRRILKKEGLCFIVVPIEKPFPEIKYGHASVFTQPKTLDNIMGRRFVKKHSLIRKTSIGQKEYWYFGRRKKGE